MSDKQIEQRLAQIHDFPVKQQALTEQETRDRFTQKRRPWDPQWGGRCPYDITEEEKKAMAKRNMAQQEPWTKAFDGVGVGIFFLACLLLFLVIFSQLGHLYGWWGGAW